MSKFSNGYSAIDLSLLVENISNQLRKEGTAEEAEENYAPKAIYLALNALNYISKSKNNLRWEFTVEGKYLASRYDFYKLLEQVREKIDEMNEEDFISAIEANKRNKKTIIGKKTSSNSESLNKERKRRQEGIGKVIFKEESLQCQQISQKDQAIPDSGISNAAVAAKAILRLREKDRDSEIDS